MRRALVVDFEGTITEENLLAPIVAAFGEPSDMGSLNVALHGGAISLNDVIEQEFARVRAPLADVLGWAAEHVRMRPGLRELVGYAEKAGLHFVVLSGAFAELIEPLLEREGIHVEVRANRVDAGPNGWRVLWQSPEVCEECHELCKRAALPKAEELIYVGDGMSDRCAALAACRIFAMEGLARYLDEVGVPYEPFGDLNDVVRALAAA